MVIGQGGRLASVGIAVGLAGSFALTRVLEEMPQKRAPRGEAELTDTAFRRMTGGEKERCTQLRQGARHFA